MVARRSRRTHRTPRPDRRKREPRSCGTTRSTASVGPAATTASTMVATVSVRRPALPPRPRGYRLRLRRPRPTSRGPDSRLSRQAPPSLTISDGPAARTPRRHRSASVGGTAGPGSWRRPRRCGRSRAPGQRRNGNRRTESSRPASEARARAGLVNPRRSGRTPTPDRSADESGAPTARTVPVSSSATEDPNRPPAAPGDAITCDWVQAPDEIEHVHRTGAGAGARRTHDQRSPATATSYPKWIGPG